jgi:hypothetical protein
MIQEPVPPRRPTFDDFDVNGGQCVGLSRRQLDGYTRGKRRHALSYLVTDLETSLITFLVSVYTILNHTQKGAPNIKL